MSAGQDLNITQLFSSAFALHQQGKLQEAASLYQQLLALQPAHADALHLLGVIAHQFGNHDSALTLISAALKLQPRNASFHYNLASVYQATRVFDAAIKHYKQSIKFQDKNADAWSNLAVLYLDTEQLQLARQANQQALKINRKHPAALQNMATLLYQLGHYDDAKSYLVKLLLDQPMLAEAQNKLSSIQLLQDEYQLGWQNYQWRNFSPEFLVRNPVRIIPFPRWTGNTLSGSTLLINGDQGVGDVVMFASCLPDVLQLVDQVLLECDARLVSLFKRSFPQLDVTAKTPERDFYWQREHGPVSCRINMAELGVLLRGDEAAFPRQPAYLQVDADMAAQWQARLNSLGAGLKIGISWRGGADARAHLARSIPLMQWQALAALPNVHLINLQYGDHEQEINQFNASAAQPLHCFSELNPMTGLDDFAALVSALDLVISIDNTTVHIAGALNVPVWILLPHTPDWRWLLKRSDSPWYLSARLFRAQAMGSAALGKVLHAAVKTLAEELHSSTFIRASESAQVGKATFAVTQSSVHAAAAAENLCALLLNDTSAWQHWGHGCTSLALHARLRQKYDSVVSVPLRDTAGLAPFPATLELFADDSVYAAFTAGNAALVEKISQADVVVINGEGTLHGMSQASLGLLYLAYIAKKRLHKRVCVINHSCYPDDNRRDATSAAYAIYQLVYAQLDYIAVRENISSQEFTRMGITAVQSFDALPLFIEQQYQRKPVSNEQPYIVLTGSAAWAAAELAEIRKFITLLDAEGIRIKLLIGAAANMGNDDIAFVQALAGSLGDSCGFMLASSEDEWLQVIEQAQVLVSGHFHHTVAAAFLGTPIVVTAGSTPEIEGLLAMMEIAALFDNNAGQLAERLFAVVMQLRAQPELNILHPERRAALLELAQLNYAGF